MFTFVPNEAARIAAVTRPTDVHSPLVLRLASIRRQIDARTVVEALSEWHVEAAEAYVSPSRVGPNPFTSVDRAMPLPW